MNLSRAYLFCSLNNLQERRFPMLYQTHFAGGLAAGAAVLLYTHAPCSAVLPALMVAGIAGIAPDIDHGGSLPNKSLGLPGKVVSTIIPHRTATHSLLAAAGLVLCLLALQVPHLYLLAAAAGLLSHLVLDSLNPHGVPWLWPLPIKIGVPLITTGHIGETFIIRPACYITAGFFVARYFSLI
jgi:inner membrane protein